MKRKLHITKIMTLESIMKGIIVRQIRVMSYEILFSSYLLCLVNCLCDYTEKLLEMFDKCRKAYIIKQIIENTSTDKTETAVC
jgi:hypothetical protein